MKNIIYILNFLIFVSCNESSQIKNDLTELDLKGNVKSLVEFSYPKLSTNWEYKDIEYHFDNSGYLIKKIDFDYDTYTEFNFDDKNRISQGKQYSLNDSLMFNGIYKYENQKLKKREVLNLENEIVYSAEYTYSNPSNGTTLIEEKEYDQKNNLQRHSTILQNSKKQDIAWNEFNLEGKLMSRHDYKYNDKGNRIEYVKKDSTNELKWRVETKYNTDNLEIERILYNPKLDKKTIRISTYEFDNMENWIVKYQIQNNDTLKTFKRKIKYY
ncbi:hypothetical protein OE09_1572 [Flavobacteriaceae bacterium MAR_2010_72]|nr:hypothetical protein OE09_1572 [Flavobacteriaceae bacterium MAR_2010_72]TVZ59235.1 hypothetical protein NA63_1762 [Flavobacteriaceae bacterium MAR_2010_105]